MSRVAVEKSVLKWAINRSGFPIEKLQLKFPQIMQWIDGETHPTLRQLESIAKTTYTPFGFFFLSNPPKEKLPIPHFRTYAENAPVQLSLDLLDTIQMMQLRQSWMREYMIEQGQTPLPIIRSARLDESPISVADKIRSALKLNVDWAEKQSNWTHALRLLRDLVENAGILVAGNGIVGNNTHRKLKTDEFRGFVLVDEYAPLVFINNNDFVSAKIFTLAHELAHVLFGSSAAFDLRDMQPANDATEKACNSVAAEFLIPEQNITQIWPSIRHETGRFKILADKFKVSELVAARRALDLALIQKSDFFIFYENYKKVLDQTISKPAKGGGDFYLNQNLRIGKRFARTVIGAAKEGKLLYSEAYKLTGLYGKSFSKYAEKLGLGGEN